MYAEAINGPEDVKRNWISVDGAAVAGEDSGIPSKAPSELTWSTSIPHLGMVKDYRPALCNLIPLRIRFVFDVSHQSYTRHKKCLLGERHRHLKEKEHYDDVSGYSRSDGEPAMTFYIGIGYLPL